MISMWAHKLDKILEGIERGLAIGLYLLLISFVTINIIARNVWHMASHRLLELAPAVVLWLALVGATLALKHQRHIKIELVLRLLSAAGQQRARVVTVLFAMGVCGILASASVPFLLNEVVLFGVWGWLAVCFPVFFCVAFLRFGLILLRLMGLAKETP